MIDNVQLWFAKNENNKIVTINEIKKENKNKYYCPLCNSEVIPRQGEINSWCFAHIDKSKCSSESMYHFWIKNKLLQQGDRFRIKSDVEKEYLCDEILVEETYKVNDKEYRPDLTVKTTNGETIYFEMNYSNEKKLEDYLDIWMELNNIVVEIDVKTLINSTNNKLPTFKAKYYKGKCFNIKNGEDTVYHDTIGKYKEQLKKNGEYEVRKRAIDKLDWLWKDIQRYKMNQVGIEYIYRIITSIHNEQDRRIVIEVLKKNSCQQIKRDIVEFNINSFDKIIRDIEKQEQSELKYSIKIPRSIYDRIYKGIQTYIIDDNNSITYNHIDRKQIIEDIKSHTDFINIKKYDIKYNYSQICNYIDYCGFPKIDIGIDGWNNVRLYLNNFKKNTDNYSITINNVKNKENVIKEVQKRLGGDNLYFNGNEITIINDMAKRLKKDYHKNIQIQLYAKCSDLYVAYGNNGIAYQTVYAEKKDNINFNNLEKMIRKNIKSIRNENKKKRRIKNKYIKDNDRDKICQELYDIRIYKKVLFSQLKQHQQVLNIKPMCNKPYFMIYHQNSIKNIVFLSPKAYQKSDILEQHDMITILNKNTYNTIFDQEDITNHILINYNNTNVFINQKLLVKQFLQDELKKYQDIFNKRINLFYHKSKPLNKKYKNLYKFDFVKCTDIFNEINNSQVDFSKLEIKNNNHNYSNMIELQSNIIRRNKYVNDFFKLFLYAIESINNDEINLLLNVKYTGSENNQFRYQPWLINDFIYMLEHLGFTNINNIESKEDWND
ncbi:hypothetical protein CLOHAE12215_01348 [Clostridium haemolyticum]|uniref:competence protein CoiA family protein n=1 Tax=Clostridium TaxID=1485 RepID=UPI001C3B63F6|nr:MULTISPECIES: competence protein CoiA family protein [Clostridium]MCD3217335.1 hypothetical protein [Clostridium botulinum C]CAG7839932.1 hypothetical protein CLOHAE12215_01348 [Clostridium haemolyticum]